MYLAFHALVVRSAVISFFSLDDEDNITLRHDALTRAMELANSTLIYPEFLRREIVAMYFFFSSLPYRCIVLQTLGLCLSLLFAVIPRVGKYKILVAVMQNTRQQDK